MLVVLMFAAVMLYLLSLFLSGMHMEELVRSCSEVDRGSGSFIPAAFRRSRANSSNRPYKVGGGTRVNSIAYTATEEASLFDIFSARARVRLCH
jgi:hypothetical protein